MPGSKKSPLMQKFDLFQASLGRFRELPFEDGGPAAVAMNKDMKLTKMFIEGARRHKKEMK